MSSHIPLRFSTEEIRRLLAEQNPHEELILIREKSFERPEDLIEEAKRLINLVKNDVKPKPRTVRDFTFTFAFAFLLQQIDALYLEKSKELQSLFDKEIWEDIDHEKEREIKAILRDLLRCEVEIENMGNEEEYSPILYSQLETLFDDVDLLDLVLLLLSKKIPLQNRGPSDLSEDLNIKCFSFVFPFLKLFYGGNCDVLDHLCRRNAQEFLKESNVIEKVQKDIERLLSQHTDLSESEISRFGEEIKSPSGDRKLRQIITREKKRFKEEKAYYEVLGNLSLLLYLWKQEAAEHKVFMPLFRVGIVCYPYFVRGLQVLKIGPNHSQFEPYWRFHDINLKNGQTLPIKILKYLLEKKDLNEEDFQVIELSFSALSRFMSLMNTLPQIAMGESIDLLLTSEDNKSLLMHELYEFLNSKILDMNNMQSSYLIASSLSESVISEWLSFYNAAWPKDSEKNHFSPFKILLNDLMEFIASEEHASLTLPEYLQSNLISACSQFCRNRDILAKSDLEKILLNAHDIGKRSPLRLKMILNLVQQLVEQMKFLSNRVRVSWADDVIKEIPESKFIEEFIVAYEENPSFLQTSGDLNVTELVCQLFCFLANFSMRGSPFLEKKRNFDFMQSVLKDFGEIDLRLVHKKPYYSFSCAINILFLRTEFAKHLKDEKLLFGILRILLFSPFDERLDFSGIAEQFWNDFSEDLTCVHLFENLLGIYENKMRNPSLDFYDALKQFESRIEDEKTNFQQENYLEDKNSLVLNAKTSIDSLKRFAWSYDRGLLTFAKRIPLPLNEQGESMITRFMKMLVDPLIMFSGSSFSSFLGKSISDLLSNQEAFLCVFEGIFAGIVDICKEFKFNDSSVISKLDPKRLCKMVTKIAALHFLRREDIPEDITYQEAALMSLILGVSSFNKSLQALDKKCLKNFEILEVQQFKEVIILLDQVENNILKCCSQEITKESNDVWQNFLEDKDFSLDFSNHIFDVFYQVEKLKTPTEEIYKLSLARFNLVFDQGEELAGLVYNTLRLKEFGSSSDNNEKEVFAYSSRLFEKNSDNGLWISMITSPEGLKSLLKCELYLLECAHRYCDSKTKNFVFPLADLLEDCFKKNDLAEKKEFKDAKNLFEVIVDFVKKLAESRIPQRYYKILMKHNLEAVFAFFENVYKSYSKYVKNNLEMIESYKEEIQKYIDAVVRCQQYYLVNLKGLVSLGEEFNSAVPRNYWISLFKQNSENLLNYLKEDSPKDQGIYQLDYLYQSLEQLFIKEIANELNLDKNLIENLLMAGKDLLKNLTSETLMTFAKEKECFDLPDIIGGFISRISKLAINSIVSNVLENNCQCNEKDSFLLMSLDLAESALSAQKSVLQGMRRDIFSESDNCFYSLVCLMNAILRANKALRIEFLKRDLLRKLLTVERQTAFKAEEITSILSLMSTLLEDGLFKPQDLSQIAEECLQVVLESLIENFSFDKESIASLAKVKEQQESKQNKQLSRRGLFLKDYFVAQTIKQQDETYDEPHVYLDENLNRQMILKNTSALVVVLSGILSSYPHFIPSVIFQEISIEDLLKENQEIKGFFCKPSCSVFDALLRLILLKDGSSAIFFIASLIQDDKIKSALLIKTFEILKDIMVCEETQGQAVQNLNSILMRRNIAIIIAFISNEVNKNESFSNKEEILQLIKETTQKLLHNPLMIAYSMQSQLPQNESLSKFRFGNQNQRSNDSCSIIQILSKTVKQNTETKEMSADEIKSNYAQILKALKTRTPEKESHVSLQDDMFEKNVFLRNKIDLNSFLEFSIFLNETQ